MKRELVEELLIVVGLPQQSRKLSIKLGSGKLRPQRPPSPRHFSSAEAKAIGLMEELYPRTPGRFGGEGLLHDGSPNAQGVDDLLCAVLHPLWASRGEAGRISAVPRSGGDGWGLREPSTASRG